MSEPVHVVVDADSAATLLDRTRLQILERLAEPASASTLAQQLDVPRQRLNYHLHELERHGLVALHHAQRRGSVHERVYRRTGDSYTISAAALGPMQPRPDAVQDRFSSAHQIAVASQAIADLATLRAGAAAAGQALPTIALEVDVRFADAAARNTFAAELADAVGALVKKHHDDRAPAGRTFRFYLGGYPKVGPA